MKPERIYYEPASLEYALGKELKKRYEDVPWIAIESHNRITELQERENSDFAELKRYLIIGTRKTHKYTVNQKISDFLVPYTSSGCPAMCLYCYLVCSYNKCSYLRIYTNREEMLKKLIRRSYGYEKSCTFEIGSNSDLVIENEFTGNLPLTIEAFGREGKGAVTFPTKFSMVKPLLDLEHRGKTIFRMSVNPQEIITQVEIGTASLKARIRAVNEMCEAGYPVGLILAPVILLDNWKELYGQLLDELETGLTEKVKKVMFLEVIFMTYSYVHRAINDQAFPEMLALYNKEKMTGRGRGKYCYRQEYRDEAERWLRAEIGKRFAVTEIVYVV